MMNKKIQNILMENIRSKVDDNLSFVEKIYSALSSKIDKINYKIERSMNGINDIVQESIYKLVEDFKNPGLNPSENFFWRYSYDQLNSILKEEMCPCAFVDMENFEENLDFIEKELARINQIYNKKVKIRIGTKSVRVPGLIAKALERNSFEGVFLYHPNEIEYLHQEYKIKDFMIAYPIINKIEADLCCKTINKHPDVKIHLMADSTAHLHILEKSAKKYDVTLGIIVDCDFSVEFMGQTAGVLRSPLNTPEKVVNFTKKITKEQFPHLEFRGIMGYEAQNAGIGDHNIIYNIMKKYSREQINIKRNKIVSALKEAGFFPKIVNGGGSGCFQETASEEPITEVTIGSGLFKSYIFDPIESMNGFKPSLFMALRIVRFPRKGIATAFSGGYVCSATNKEPIIVLPNGCKSITVEGFGEVQTPIKYNPSNIGFKHGDIVICRLAKAGEPMERFKEVIAISKGKIVQKYSTYRGLGIWGG